MGATWTEGLRRGWTRLSVYPMRNPRQCFVFSLPQIGASFHFPYCLLPRFVSNLCVAQGLRVSEVRIF